MHYIAVVLTATYLCRLPSSTTLAASSESPILYIVNQTPESDSVNGSVLVKPITRINGKTGEGS